MDEAPSADQADGKPTGERGAHGYFQPGNRAGLAARLESTIRKPMGDPDAPGAGAVVSRDARRLFGAIVRTLPSDNAAVRALLGVATRHLSLHAYFTAKAEAAGLDTEAGLGFLAIASRESQRAERVLVTVHDLARVHAARGKVSAGTSFLVEPDDDAGETGT